MAWPSDRFYQGAEMSFFKIVMPNYNNAGWLDKSIGSVLNQTFTDYDFIFVDDISEDDSYAKAKEMAGMAVENSEKRWNGGSRNVGLEYFKGSDSEYTLFLDSDDWLVDNSVLQKLHDFIEDEEYPDCVRLPYKAIYEGDKTLEVMLDDDTPEKLAGSIFVACWTKCIKSELIQPFPENTLMEDVVQHIKQCDVIKDVVPFYRPVVIYNRNNTNSCSNEQNQDLQNGKWQSSMFRYMADLLDLELDHDYCKKQRDWRANICLNNIKNGKYTQSVE